LCQPSDSCILVVMEARRRGGWNNSTVSDQEVRDLLDGGMSKASEIARHLTANGKPISQQAISKRIRNIRDADEERANYILPWRVNSRHAYGWVYISAVALGKHLKGIGLTPAQLTQAAELEEFLRERDAVLTYDHERGFLLRNRRPDDGPGALAA